MATREEIFAAIKNADTAGDSESVRKLAAYLKTMEAPQQPIAAVKPIGKQIIDVARPTVEALGAVGGAILGTPIAPPFGTVGGAGLGYGIATTGLNALEEQLGYRKPVSIQEGLTQGATDIAAGSTMEGVARAIGPAIAKGFGAGADIVSGDYATKKAAKIAREALGPDAPAVMQQLRSAPPSMTAAQASAKTNSPVWQSLNEVAASRDPRFYGGILTPTQQTAATNMLANIAGGGNQTAMRGTQYNALGALNKELIPVLKTELNAANTAGILKPKLEGQANRFGDAAAAKVEDVRRFTAAGERAGGRAATTTLVPGYPNVPGRYTYMGELEKRAEQVTQQAADASLPFGEASRFAQAASDSLAAHGLRPLEARTIQEAIRQTSSKPEFAGNRDISKVMSRISEDIGQWTNQGGVIDAYALDAIRKNSINGVIRELYPSAEKSVQKELAASVLTTVKPLIVDAIEKAGGNGYGKYLADYSTGRHAIDQMKMGAVAADLFKNNQKAFVDLVEGNSPKEVEKVFGSGKYDIAKEMNPDAMRQLRVISELTNRSIQAGEQATLGQKALAEIIQANTFKFKIPWGLSPKTMAMNRAIDIAERRLSGKTMNILAEGLKSGASASELVTYLPAKERVNMLRVLADPSIYRGAGASMTPNQEP